MAQLLGDDCLLCLPTAPGIAPKLNTAPEELEAFRARAFALLAVAGLASACRRSVCQLELSTIARSGYR